MYAGNYGIEIKDYAGISSRCTIYAQSDDYSGEYMVGACLPDNVRNIISGKVIIDKYSIIGASSVILPNVVISEGVALGAMSFVNKNTITEPWCIYVGVPARVLKKRSQKLMNLVERV